MIAAVAVVATVSAAPWQAPPQVPGSLVEHVVCPSDPTQTYTLYLPSNYSRSRKWPLLFVFDPRGRGTLAAEIFRAGAERHGWIVASSNNTRSDSDWRINQRAVNAMWPDVRAAYAVDERRIYAAGFSGGATVALTLAASGARLAGIIGVGGPDVPKVPVPASDVAWFGAAGRWDFNYVPVKQTAERLERANLRTRLEFFDGTHTWLPDDLATRAITWLEVLASDTANGTAPEQRLQEIAADELAYARQLHEAGRTVEARRAFGIISRDYPRTPAASEAAQMVLRLDQDKQFLKTAREEEKTDGRERERIDRFREALRPVTDVDVSPADTFIRELRISDLQKTAARGGYAGDSARRSLEQIFVQTSFYMSRQLEERGEWRQTAVLLEIALAIHADRPRVWVDLAAARAMLRQTPAALQALDRAVALGFANGDALRSDPRFASLRDSAQFQQLLARIPVS